MTSTVLRVKRRAEDSPHEALVVLCKRLKAESADGKAGVNLASSVFVFSGTVDDQENIHHHIKKLLPKSESKSQDLHSAKGVKEILKKVRKEHKENINESRYEILRCGRGLEGEGLDGDQTEDGYTLVDVAKKTDNEETDIQYAYDLYFSHKADFDVSMLDDIVRGPFYLQYQCGQDVCRRRIEQLEGDLVLGSHRDNGCRSSSSEASSDDSNDENNWRNDYPDTEGSSIGEEDMRRAFERCDIDNDLSSDSGEEQIYEEQAAGLAAPAPAPEDVQRYGIAYARYKARALAGCTDVEDKSNLVYCTPAAEVDGSAGYKDEEDGFYYGMEEDADHFVSQYAQTGSEDELPD